VLEQFLDLVLADLIIGPVIDQRQLILILGLFHWRNHQLFFLFQMLENHPHLRVLQIQSLKQIKTRQNPRFPLILAQLPFFQEFLRVGAIFWEDNACCAFPFIILGHKRVVYGFEALPLQVLPNEGKFGLWGGEILEVGNNVDEVCLAVVLVAVVGLEVLLSELEIEVVLG